MKNTLFRRILYRNILLSVISFIFIMVVGMVFLYHFIYNNVKNDNQRVANLVSLRVANYMELAIQRAKYMSQEKSLLSDNPGSTIKNNFAVSGVYDSINLINRNGKILSYYPEKEEFSKEVISEMIRTNSPYSVYYENMHIFIVTPIKEEKGRINKFLICGLDREKSRFFKKLIIQTRDKSGGMGYIVDSQGNILFHNDKLKLSTRLPLNYLPSIARGPRQNISYPSISSMSKINIVDWYVIVETPLHSVLKPLYGLVLIIVLIFIGLFTVYSVLTYFSLKKNLYPIKELISEMTLFSRLDYYEPISVKGTGEIAYLYEAYNIMVKRLKNAWELEQETFEELKRAEKLSVVGELAAGAAHEIRNPLTTIKGFIQLYYDNGKSITSEHKGLIFSELKHIEQITNEFLMLSKPQMNIYREYSIQSIIDEVCLLIEEEAELNKVEMINQVQCNCEIYCVPPLIKQVFINISRNAIQAMAKKGGKLTIECREDKLNKGSYITFTDTGPGIPKEHLDKLDQPFFTTKSNSTGLGLTVTYKIIQNHYGKISVNTNSKGTAFTIWLPSNYKQGS